MGRSIILTFVFDFCRERKIKLLTFLKKKNKVIDFKTVIVFSLKIKKNKNCYCVYLVFIVFVFSFSRKKLEIFHGQYTYMIHNPFVIKKLKFLR